MIKYYRSPYFVLILTTPNHGLWLKNILHPFIWVIIWLYLFLWRSTSVIVPFLKTTSPYFMPYHLLCLVSLFFIFRIHMSNIKFRYVVYISPPYSSSFSRLSLVFHLVTWWFASKSNCHYKLRVTIWFILFHNPSSKFVDRFTIFTMSTIDISNFFNIPLLNLNWKLNCYFEHPHL